MDFIQRINENQLTNLDKFLFIFTITAISLYLAYLAYKLLTSSIKIVTVKRKTSQENRYSKKMGRLVTNVTKVKLYFMFIPIKTFYKYRDTYYGEIKELEDCDLDK